MINASKNICTESLWGQFSIPLRKFIKRRVKSNNDVEDILQNVFLKIHSNISRLKEYEKIHAWIYTITRNSIVDFYREQKNEKELSEISEDMIAETVDDSSANGEIAKCLTTMIDYLPEKYRQAIILTEFNNLTQKELSENLDLSISGAKSRVQRARSKLKDMLLSCCHFEFDKQGNIIDYKQKCKDCKFC